MKEVRREWDHEHKGKTSAKEEGVSLLVKDCERDGMALFLRDYWLQLDFYVIGPLEVRLLTRNRSLKGSEANWWKELQKFTLLLCSWHGGPTLPHSRSTITS